MPFGFKIRNTDLDEWLQTKTTTHLAEGEKLYSLLEKVDENNIKSMRKLGLNINPETLLDIKALEGTEDIITIRDEEGDAVIVIFYYGFIFSEQFIQSTGGFISNQDFNGQYHICRSWDSDISIGGYAQNEKGIHFGYQHGGGFHGGIRLLCLKYSSGALSGSNGAINCEIPIGSKIIGIQGKVKSEITGPTAVDLSWDANLQSQEIVSGLLLAQGTQFGKFFDNSNGDIVGPLSANIDISPVGDDFISGEIEVIVYFYVFKEM